MLRALYTRLLMALRGQEGQGMVEYGLIIALIAVVVIGTLTAIGLNLDSLFQTIRDNLD